MQRSRLRPEEPRNRERARGDVLARERELGRDAWRRRCRPPRPEDGLGSAISLGVFRLNHLDHRK